MTRNDIHPGYFIILSNNSTFKVIKVPTGKYLMPVGSSVSSLRLEDICNEDLTPKLGLSPIAEIKECNGNTIWTKPVEMTIAEIEKALKMNPGSLRIKK